MNEMIERVAKAIEDCHDEGSWSTWEQIGHQAALECARAAIAAMRESTDAMIEAGDWKIDFDCRDSGKIWNAMVDAALTPEPNQKAPE